ncbi:MAG TPA: 2-C-methyl-D-erythritol 4-phosphate cytidylyltransferase [Clostridiales bacterium]|nr:2-C-methyl-D-erythritol 4-phosphate cytidylyltransferase [Clostridiales bacterium]
MTGAILVAAGKGTRMGTAHKKPFLDLLGMPVLAYALKAFEQAPSIHQVVVVVHPGDEAFCRKHVVERFGFEKVLRIVPGGESRQDSVKAGMDVFGKGVEILAVHDGARPLVTPALIEKTVSACREEIRLRGCGSVCAAVPVKDTLRMARPDESPEAVRSGKLSEHCIYSDCTLDRRLLWAVQTPQVFDRALLVRAHAQAACEGFSGTDDTLLAERLGVPARLVHGEYTNIKITTREDLLLARLLLEEATGCPHADPGLSGVHPLQKRERGEADDQT